MHRWVRCCKKHNLSRPLYLKIDLGKPIQHGFPWNVLFLGILSYLTKRMAAPFICMCMYSRRWKRATQWKKAFYQQGERHWHSLCTKLKSKRWMHFSRLDGEECSTSILAGNYVTYFHACVSTNRHKWIYHVARLIKLQLQQQSQLREKEKN